MNEQNVMDSISDHSVGHARGTYRTTLLRFRADPLRSDTADLFFRATPDGGGDSISFRLHVSEETVNNRVRLREAIDHTIGAILDGRLPPDAIDLL
jgi:hypothetical protein